MSSDWISAVRAADIPDNGCVICDLDDEDIAIYNLGGEYFAIEDRCSHDGGDLASGWVEAGCAVCPRHGARFDIRTGRVVAPPAYEDIHAFPVRLVDGMVQIRDDRD
ncbi:ferredoxin [Salinisphaera orenii MK-B5]|uniref:Ferredoxin n=1 Tax=Salinisphaera orenii MK-B5 TaxID=856730 RepID=A0A423PNS6_9GAMM|nr:non-heme iron oxygenase ferredoxin subunit [Salinisphaera orenii]ROO27265.1 ferredoxin [Salinisphaera orenii MK-B5]